jgi:hypothetical protein
VAIAMKSTLVVLLFSLLACVAVKLWRERCRELLFLTLPWAFYLTISLNSGLGNGIRHILPVLPFCVVFAAAGVWSLAANRRSWKVVLGAAIALHALSSLRAFPNYISYGNELWGGPENTYAYLADANVDWGQGLKMAKSYVKRTHSQPCWIVQISWVPDYEIPCGESSPTRHEIPPVHFKGTLIVSSWEVSGMGTGSVRAMEIFRGRKPVATLAGSAMLVYEGEFDLSPIAAAEHFNLAQMARDPARTVSELELAAALDPGYAAPHLQLCSLAGQRGDMERAERECNVALDLSRKDPTTPSATTRSLARFMQRRGIRIRARDVAENSTGQ